MTTSVATSRFQLPADVQEAFTYGDCWHLAKTINRLTGYPVVTAQWQELQGSGWCHAANRLPDGRILDIEGVWLEEEWLWKWQAKNPATDMELEQLVMFAQEWTEKGWAQEIAECGFDFYYPGISGDVKRHATTILTLATA